MKTENKVAQLLKSKNKTISVAESCSGGMLASRLTDVPGSTEYFQLGIVTYSNEAKTKLLKVPSELIDKHGAVSTEVAELMAQNIRKIQKTDFGVGITGIAGPSGGTKRKPVGLVYIAIATKIETLCLKCQFTGTRTQVKKQTTDQALSMLLEFLDI